jgi:hypothetical protein
MMVKARYILAVLVTSLVVIGFAACSGGGGHSSGDAVAQVGETAITRAELDHWMATLTGGDFYGVARSHRVPAELASEPPNYPACVASLQAAGDSARSQQTSGSAPSTKQTAAQLLSKCRQLYVALRLQAISYLVNAEWNIGVYADLGIRASDAEVQRLLKEVKATEYPAPGQFQQFLTNNRRSLADELLVLKVNVLEQKLQRKVGIEGVKRISAELSEAGKKWTDKTDCRPGYVVPHCRQFRKWKTTTDPVVLLERVATITGIPCINREACG